jgi:predicted SnoaL-like aldol condensation-catalyzing enzyme
MQTSGSHPKYAGDVYLQHNPGVADGKEAFIEYIIRMAASFLENVCISNE